MNHRISSLAVFRAGHTEAWYPHLHASLVDSETGHPLDTLIELRNFGGKTTLLAFLLSVLEPNKSHFLKHVQDRKIAFKEYFDQDHGQPAVIAIEWDAGATSQQNFLEPERERFVTGQLVSYEPREEREYRRFFAFTCTKTLNLAALCGEGALPPEQQITGLRTYAHGRQWADLMRREWAHKAEFWDTDNQAKWKDYLESTLDLDLTLVQSQLRFNHQESGVEQRPGTATFFQFSDQEDFVRKFVAITLPQDEVADVMDTVRQGLDRIREVPQLERRRALLRRFAKHFEPFVKTAQACEAQRAAHQEDLAHAGAVRRYIEQLSEAAAARFQAAEQAVTEADQDLITTCEAQRLAEQTLASIRCEIARLRHAAQQTLVADLKARAATAGHRCQLLLAKQEWDDIQDKEQAKALLEEQMRQEQASVEAFRATAEEAGAHLSRAIHAAIAEQEEALRGLEARIATHQRNRHKAREERERLDQQRDRIRSRAERAERAIEAAEEARQTGLARGDLLEGETAHQALVRMRDEGKTLEDDTARLQSTAGDLGTRQQDLHEQQLAVSSDMTRVAERLETLRAQLVRAQDEEQALRSHAFLAGLMQTCEFAFPDAVAEVRTLIQRCDDNLLDAEVEAQRLNRDAQSIHQHGVAGVASEVDQVTAALRHGGVQDAQAYGVYIANTVPDEEAARQLFASDVGRFTGVFVPTREALAHATALGETLQLARPVVLSTGTTTPAAHPAGDCVTVGPRGAAMFNRDAAQQLLKELDTKQANNRKDRDRLVQRRKDAHQCLLRLERYLADYGDGRLEDKAEDVQHLEQEAVELETQCAGLAGEAAELRQRSRDVHQALEKAAKKTSELQTRRDRVTDYQRQHEAPLAGHKKQRDDARTELGLLETERKRLQGEIEVADDGVEKANRAKPPYLRQVGSLKERQRGVQYRADGWEALPAPDLPIQQLATRYESAREAFEARLQGRARDLQSRIHDLDGDVETRRARYEERYGELDPAAVEAQTWSNFQAERAARHQEAEEAKEALQEANRRLGELHQAWKDARQVKSRPYDALETLSLEELEAECAAREPRLVALAEQKAGLEARLKRLGEEEKAADNARRDLRDAASFVQNLAPPESSMGVPAPTFPAEEAQDAAREAAEQCRESAERHQKEQAQLRRSYDPVRNALADKAFHEEEPALRSAFLANGDNVEALGREAASLFAKLKERIEVLEHEIATRDATLDFCAKETEELVVKGRRVLKRSLNKRIPDAVSVVGGQPILKMDIGALDVTDLRSVMRDMLSKMMGKDTIPDTGHELAAAGIQEILNRTGRKLDVRILKPLVASFDHVPVHETKASGGQGLTIPLYLYLLVTRLRGEERRRTDSGGVLLLDNPFGRASSQDLVQSQLSLARELGVQLIYLTGILDLNASSQFPLHLRLRLTGVQPGTKRKHIEVSDYLLRDAV